MANQPIPSSAGPQPAGMVPTYGAAGIFTGYAAPPPTSTVPPTQKAPVTPAPTPPPVTPATPAATPTPPAPTPSQNGTQPTSAQSGIGNPIGNGNYGATANAPYGYSTVNGQIVVNKAPANTGQVPYGSANSNNPAPAGSSTTPNANGLSTDTQTYINTVNGFSDKVNGILNGTIPLTAGEQAQIQGLEQQFQQLITQQTAVNTNNTGTAQIRGYETGTAEFDRSFQANTIGQIVSAGATKIANLQTQEASAVAQLTESLQNNDIKNIKDAYDLYTSAHADVAKSISDTVAATQQAMKDASIANVISSGTTDPAGILTALQAQGKTTITADDISKAITNLSPDAAAIYSVQTTAAANGADPATLALIAKAKSKSEALQIAAQGNVANSTVSDMATKYPDAGILPGDSVGQAQAKILKSPTYTTAQKSAALDLTYKQAQINAENAAAAKSAADAKAAGNNAPGGSSALNNDAVSFWATAAASGVNTNSLLPSLGMGAAAVGEKNAILQKISDNAAKLGINGGQFAAMLTDSRAKQSTYTKLQAQGTLLATNENKATQDMALVKSLGAKMDANSLQIGIPVLNSWLRSGQLSLTGNADVDNYLGALTTTMTAYAKVVSGQTTGQGVTDTANKETQNLIANGLSTSAVNSYFDNVATPEMGNTVSSFNSSLESLFGDIQNANTSSTSTGGLGVTPSYTTFENGGSTDPSTTSNGVDLTNFNPQ